MKVSYNWLKDYCDFSASVDELVAMLTIAGSEVESYDKAGNDYCITLEIKSNRSDLLGIMGIAREVAAITGKPLRRPSVAYKPDTSPVSKWTSVEVPAPDLCPRYTARVITGVKVGPSPRWLAERLEAVGLRSINNVVDVTNYVMMECGQPLHAFDLDTLAGRKIIVRRAAAGETITTIDDIERRLTRENLVIADARRPVAVAGIMGGADTEVTAATRNVLLESAVFNPVSVRRTARAIGLASDASYRFERGVDPIGTEWASRRSVALIAQLTGGTPADGIADANAIDLTPKKVTMRVPRIRRILGMDVPAAEAADILARLEFDVLSRSDSEITVAVPSFRAADVYREIDLIEEVGRIHGYDKVPLDSAMTIKVGATSKFEKCERLVRSVLSGCGLSEAISSSFLTPALAGSVNLWGGEVVQVANPLRAEESALRSCLIASLLHVKAINQSRGVPRCELFELGRVFLGPMAEKSCVAIMEEDGFYDLKGIVQLLLDRFGLQHSASMQPAAGVASFKEGHAVKVSAGHTLLGYYGQIADALIGRFDLKGAIWLAELDFDALAELAVLERKSQAIPKFPAIDRDLALIVDEAVTWQQVVESINALAEPLRESVSFLNVYRGKPIEPGRKSLALSMRYRSPERTLTNEEVNAAQERLIKHLEKALGATLRV
ncbi:MAG TPA: phenylalanine--tRNA ligase subunit beta [Planctomycetota bacterium]|nr:phenylalanine--tRNA ligase subunit beta [Planctomycetota bacterium]